VDGGGQQFLAGPSFSGNEYGGRRRRDLFDLEKNLLHDSVAADNAAKAQMIFHFVPQIYVFLLKSILQGANFLQDLPKTLFRLFAISNIYRRAHHLLRLACAIKLAASDHTEPADLPIRIPKSVFLPVLTSILHRFLDRILDARVIFRNRAIEKPLERYNFLAFNTIHGLCPSSAPDHVISNIPNP
jgi:hypothetical protein